VKKVEEINDDFVQMIESHPLHNVTQEIAVLALNANEADREAVSRTLNDCIATLRRIHAGQVPIPGREAGYFKRWLEIVEGKEKLQHVIAYIRIPSIQPGKLLTDNWFKTFYDKLRKLVRYKKVKIRYIFLLGRDLPDPQTEAFLDAFKSFSAEIRIIDKRGSDVAAAELKPSVVLFEDQHIVFTHDRGDNGVLIEADEWRDEQNFEKWSRRVDILKLASSVYYPSKRQRGKPATTE